MKFIVRFVLLMCWLSAVCVHADDKAVESLKRLVERQRVLLAEAAKKTELVEMEDLRGRFQDLVFDYEAYIKRHPKEPAGYVSYALLLGQPVIDERKRAAALLLKANQLDPNLPLVKNQLGNYLAEEGKPLDALNYYLAAVRLAPEEPLYHYQIGVLLTEAREDFVKSDAWTRTTLDEAMQEAFERASALAPGNAAYAYRFGESFYDLERSEWSAALAFWRTFEEKVSSPIEKETIRLHQANVLIKQEKFSEARGVLATVGEPALQAQKQKLVAQLDAGAKK